jgi:hypothetical protein
MRLRWQRKRVSRREQKSPTWLVDLALAMPDWKIQPCPILARLANHQTLQFAGLLSCELQQFAFRLVRLEAFYAPVTQSGALSRKSLMVLWVPFGGGLAIQLQKAVVVTHLLRGFSILK